MYFNHSTLIGFLGNNAEQRFTKTNTIPYTVLSLATRASWKDKQTGEYISRTDWHRCIAWGKLGEWAVGLTKGAHVQIAGELRSRDYVERVSAGEKSKKTVDVKRRVWEIRVGSILKLDRAERDQANTAAVADATDKRPSEGTFQGTTGGRRESA
jgi:single-strand DNA-binding protein